MSQRGPATLEYGQGDTWQIGGSRFALFSNYAFNPVGYGPLSEQIPYALPSVPPVYGQGQALSQDTAGTQQAAAIASAGPLHPKWSPLPWVLGGVFAAVLGLHFLHWSEREPEERREEEAA